MGTNGNEESNKTKSSQIQGGQLLRKPTCFPSKNHLTAKALRSVLVVVILNLSTGALVVPLLARSAGRCRASTGAAFAFSAGSALALEEVAEGADLRPLRETLWKGRSPSRAMIQLF